MKNIAVIGFRLTVAFVLSMSASAQEFSADMISRSAYGKVTKSRLYQTADKGRFDSTIETTPRTSIETHMIIDRREKLIYLVEPQQKTILVNHVLQAVGAASGSASSSSNPCEDLMHAINPVVVRQDFACRQVGNETVNGRRTENGRWSLEGWAAALRICG